MAEEDSLVDANKSMLPIHVPVVRNVVHNAVSNDQILEAAKGQSDTKGRRQKYKTNRPISGRQQASKRNQLSGDGDEDDELYETLPQSEIAMLTKSSGFTKKMRHQGSLEEDDFGTSEDDFTHGEPGATEPSQTTKVSKARKWSEAEDILLRDAVGKNGARHWKSIAKFVPGRTHVQCLQRWNKVLKPGLRKGPWTDEEDSILQRLVKGNSLRVNWSDVSAQIHGRSAKQCRERWSFNLDPRIKKGEWTEEEDTILVDAQKEHGNRWAHISTLLPGRTENAVKTRFKSIMRAKKREWTPEEDQQLMQLQNELGNKWEDISKRMPTRTKNAVKTRYKFLIEKLEEEQHQAAQAASHVGQSGGNAVYIKDEPYVKAEPKPQLRRGGDRRLAKQLSSRNITDTSLDDKYYAELPPQYDELGHLMPQKIPSGRSFSAVSASRPFERRVTATETGEPSRHLLQSHHSEPPYLRQQQHNTTGHYGAQEQQEPDDFNVQAILDNLPDMSSMQSMQEHDGAKEVSTKFETFEIGQQRTEGSRPNLYDFAPAVFRSDNSLISVGDSFTTLNEGHTNQMMESLEHNTSQHNDLQPMEHNTIQQGVTQQHSSMPHNTIHGFTAGADDLLALDELQEAHNDTGPKPW